jgi:hypothetical protein
LICVAWAIGCGPKNSKSQSSDSVEPSTEAAAELERLRALGYVDYSPEPAVPGDSGVTVHDEGRSHPGYNLCTVRPLGRTELTDARGNVLNTWSEEGAEFWSRSLLLDNGDLLVVGARLPERYILRFSWANNEVLWRYPAEAHHDIRPAPDGRFVTLTMKNRELPEIDPSTPVRDNALTFFQPGAADVENLSLHDVIAASSEVLSFQRVNSKKDLIDLIHANSVRFMAHPQLESRYPMYARGNILVCMRNQDSIALLDPAQRKLVWAWGQGELEGPHDATVLDDGNILIFDNGVRRKWSRVVELDPLSGEIVWEYRAPEPTDFYTASRGGAQRLPNRNTLITESNEGHAFEVNTDGEIVWEYFVPHLDHKGHRATIIRLYRYEAGFVEPLLAR